MTLYGVNNGISLQESQLIQMLQQQAARARGNSAHAQTHTGAAGAGQNMPTGEDQSTAARTNGGPASIAQWQPADPALSPENINALLLELQTQQASLDTTLLLDAAGGKTLLDYLNSPETVAKEDVPNDDADSLDRLAQVLS